MDDNEVINVNLAGDKNEEIKEKINSSTTTYHSIEYSLSPLKEIIKVLSTKMAELDKTQNGNGPIAFEIYGIDRTRQLHMIMDI